MIWQGLVQGMGSLTYDHGCVANIKLEGGQRLRVHFWLEDSSECVDSCRKWTFKIVLRKLAQVE